MTKLVIPPLDTFPAYTAALRKLQEIRARVRGLQDQCREPEPVEAPAPPSVEELAEIFLENPQAVPAAAAAPIVAARDLTQVYRDLAIAKRAAEIQEGVVAGELAKVSEKVCAPFEPELRRIGDKVATHLYEAWKASREAKLLFDRLVEAGYRAPLFVEQDSAQGIETLVKVLSDSQLDPATLGYGVGPVLRLMVAVGLVEKHHPAAKAAKV